MTAIQRMINRFRHSVFALLAAAALFISPVKAEPADWQIDAEHFSIAFAVAHIDYQQQLGLFLEAEGSFRYDPQTREFFSGRVEVQADSVFSNHEDRDDHLRGRDFLNARRNPTIVFEATEFVPAADNADQGVLRGDLTLLGQTHPVELNVSINKRADYPFGHRRETLGISAETTILRSRWGMDYGVADGLVGDEVALRFELEGIRQ
jgi:polyisoprenoid-binding protein YceI